MHIYMEIEITYYHIAITNAYVDYASCLFQCIQPSYIVPCALLYLLPCSFAISRVTVYRMVDERRILTPRTNKEVIASSRYHPKENLISIL